jgi:hypothetical protein
MPSQVNFSDGTIFQPVEVIINIVASTQKVTPKRSPGSAVAS